MVSLWLNAACLECSPWMRRRGMKTGPHPHCLVSAPVKGWLCPCCITYRALLGPVWASPCTTGYLPWVFPPSEGLGQRPGSAVVHCSPRFIAAGGGRLCMLQGVVAGRGACGDSMGGQQRQAGSMLCGACISV